jgi:hypothetical protein
MKPIPTIALTLLAIAPAAHAAIVLEPTRTFAVGIDIADVQDPPVSFLQTISDSSIVSLTRVEIGLNLVGRDVGGFAGEMFVSLNRNLGTSAVLLNQVGVDGVDVFGHGYDGWDVTFADSATNGDIHTAPITTGVREGVWQPDGRLDATTSQRLSLLSVFNSASANGEWRLNVADLELGGTMRLVSWSITFVGDDGITAVPESSLMATTAGLGLLGFALWRRRKA